MKIIKGFIFFLCIIIFSGLGISFYQEGLDCSQEKDGVCVKPKKKEDNTFIVMIILIAIIVWLVMIKQNT
jgi:predicted nucleic acid-binding Zn ribbon protein